MLLGFINDRTTPGAHTLTTHPTDPKRGRVDFNTFLKNWTPEILYKGRDTLDAFLWKGLMIRNLKPHLNNKIEVLKSPGSSSTVSLTFSKTF